MKFNILCIYMRVLGMRRQNDINTIWLVGLSQYIFFICLLKLTTDKGKGTIHIS